MIYKRSEQDPGVVVPVEVEAEGAEAIEAFVASQSKTAEAAVTGSVTGRRRSAATSEE